MLFLGPFFDTDFPDFSPDTGSVKRALLVVCRHKVLSLTDRSTDATLFIVGVESIALWTPKLLSCKKFTSRSSPLSCTLLF